jgi:uncharacterized integral membrane protein (TIGR00698 family)
MNTPRRHVAADDGQSSAGASARPALSQKTQKGASRWPGLALSAVLGALAWSLGRLPWFGAHGLSALTLAILLGMLLGNTVYPRLGSVCGPGVGFSKQTLLRLGIILYGFRLTLQDLSQVGLGGLITDILMLTSTFLLALYVGRKWLGLDLETVILIGAGSSVCGAAAVMATEPVVKAKAEQVTVAVATVVVFGSLAMFLYPALFDMNAHWGLIPGGAGRFGIYVGSTIHEVAQVVAAARAIDPNAADTAVIAKMARVMMLAPLLLVLSYALSLRHRRASRDPQATHAAHGRGFELLRSVPWFAVAFIGVVLFNSLHLLPRTVLQPLSDFDTFILAVAMAALGLTTHVSAIRRAGARPLALAALLFVWLVAGGALINREFALLAG